VTLKRVGLTISAIRTRWIPTGFGRSCDRVLNTPRRGALWSSPRMHAQKIALGAVEPREDQDFLSHLQVPQPLVKFWLEDEPRFGRSLVTLLRRVLAIDER
jgi:hypothetical protein